MIVENERYIVEIRKNYTRDDDGFIQGGEWETVVDEFGSAYDFELYSAAYRFLKEHCPEVAFFGDGVGRVRAVVLAKRNRKTKDNG